jgi:KaiC/GvpD/RAD55 family RecA-like ATPase
LKAKQPAKGEQVQRLLEKVREERELAVSLSEILSAPTITSSTAIFDTPTPSEETAVGLEKFEKGNIQGHLTLPEKDIPVGSHFNLELQIANAGRQTVLLDKIVDIIPQGFKLIAQPDHYPLENMHLNLMGKRLAPLKFEEIGLVSRAYQRGIFKIQPRVIYMTEAGQQLESYLEPAELEVTRVVLPKRIPTGYENLDDLLFGGIPENYAVILTSPIIDEVDLLIKRFLATGAKEGQITFHITTKVMGTESLAKEAPSNFYLFVCNPQADTISRSLPNIFKLKGVENLTNISIALTSALRKLGPATEARPRRCCIQIISDVLLQHKALQTRKWLAGILPELKARGFTVLAGMDPQMHSTQEVRAVLDLFDGEIDIYEKKGVGKLLRINRMAEQEYLETEILLSESIS